MMGLNPEPQHFGEALLMPFNDEALIEKSQSTADVNT
jgi:hypothetical protein